MIIASVAYAQPWQPVVLWDRSGAGEASWYGVKIVPLGDQNDDGYADWAVWALGGAPPGDPSEELVEFFHGGNPPSQQPYMIFAIDSDTTDEFAHFEGVGDVNGDGYQDWDIWWHFLSDPDNWAVSIYFGGPTADAFPDFTLRIPTAHGDVGPVGDFNGDGYDDLFRYYLPPLDYSEIFYGGSPMDTIPDWICQSPSGNRYLAWPEAHGDVNGDGYSDFISDTPPQNA